MGKSTRPRKSHKPKRARMPIIFGMPTETRTELAIEPLVTLNMFTNGYGNEALAYTLINTILTGFELLKDKKDCQVIINGSRAMKRVLVRGEDNKWGFSGDDLKDVR